MAIYYILATTKKNNNWGHSKKGMKHKELRPTRLPYPRWNFEAMEKRVMYYLRVWRGGGTREEEKNKKLWYQNGNTRKKVTNKEDK